MDEDPEGYAITTSHLPDTTAMECPSCPSSIIWIILLIVAVLLIIGAIIWIIALYHRDRNCEKNCGVTGPGIPIQMSNPKINVDNDTQITGTWTTTDPGDTVILYATLHPPRFNALGGLDNPTAATLFKKADSSNVSTGVSGATGVTGTIPGNDVNSVPLSGLTKGVKYYATLIARNGKTYNYKSYTQIVYMQSSNVIGSTGNTFEIQDILQVGALQVLPENPSNGVYNVQFNQRTRQARDLFFFNASNQLQLSDTGGLSNVCLFNNGGNLVAADCGLGVTGAVAGSSANNGQWVYNPNKYANKICLKNTLDSNTPTCLKLTSVGNGTGTVAVTSNTDAGDAWALAFENPQ